MAVSADRGSSLPSQGAQRGLWRVRETSLTNQCVAEQWNRLEIQLTIVQKKTNVVDVDVKHKQKLVLHTGFSSVGGRPQYSCVSLLFLRLSLTVMGY